MRIVAIGTARAVGTVRSQWRADLPLLGPDGGVALLQDSDVVIVDVDSHTERTRFRGGAADLWTLVRWNGFRPRAKGLDVPVSFDADSDSTAVDSAAVDTVRTTQPPVPGATTQVAPTIVQPLSPAVGSAVRPPSTAASPPPPAARPRPRRTGARNVHAFVRGGPFEGGGKDLAASILVDGHPARVVPGLVDGTPIFRVVYGPFDTHDAAVSAGKRTGLPYWVYEGAP